jgi:integrase
LARTPRQANRALAVVSQMLNLAERWEFRPLNSNPCPRIPRYPEVARRRYATAEELRRLGAVLRTYAVDFPHEVAFLRLLLYTGARPSELLRASKTCLETRPDGMGVLRIKEGKTGQRTVFLPHPAMRMLTCLSPFRTTLTGLTAMPTRLWNLIRHEAGCPDLWARDCRRTFATVGYSEGVPLEQMADILGHTDQQTTRVYARLMEDPAARAVAATAGTMERLLSAG